MINIYNWRFKALLYVLMQVEYIGYVTPYGEHHRYYIIRAVLFTIFTTHSYDVKLMVSLMVSLTKLFFIV